MKKIKLILLLLSLLLLASCIKQKNCTGCEIEEVGMFQYLKEPLHTGCGLPASSPITAVLYNGVSSECPIFIVGKVPNKFMSEDLITVRVCLEHSIRDMRAIFIGTYELKCIEKED